MNRDGSMKIVVVSDTHADNEPLNRVIEKEWPFDYLIHCGDIEEDPEWLILDHRAEFGMLVVKGNCDFFLNLPTQIIRDFGFYKVMIVHGHMHGVRSGHQALLQAARKNFADVVLYGHTHAAAVEYYEEKGVLIVNPGSLTMNRPFGSPGTYAILTLSEDAMPSARIAVLEE